MGTKTSIMLLALLALNTQISARAQQEGESLAGTPLGQALHWENQQQHSVTQHDVAQHDVAQPYVAPNADP
ncbi:MAG: hypothetical protein MI861_27070, partial [Pirellulales bacterium]|nr:hypothetical protein [Pirellulales bacterium]